MFAHILRPSLGKQRRNLHKSISPILRQKLENKQATKQLKQNLKRKIQKKQNKKNNVTKTKHVSKQPKAANNELAKAWKMRDQFS